MLYKINLSALNSFSNQHCKSILLVLILCLFAINSNSQHFSFTNKINKAFEALDVYNYFEAKQLFTKSVEKYPCIANYGLSIIHERNDNPFHNYDSAYANILISLNSLQQITKRDSLKLVEFSIDSLVILKQKHSIEEQAFAQAKSIPGISSMQKYISYYKSSPFIPTAINIRDSLAFELALKEHTSHGYNRFIEEYPNSQLINEAKTRYQRSLFNEETEEGTINSYQEFIQKHPDSPHIREAQRNIYELFTGNSNDPSVFYQYIKQYNNSPFKDEAWQRVYDLFMSDYDENAVIKFNELYPDYPYQNQLLVDYKLANETYLPYRSGKLWGFINLKGEIVIEAAYDFVELFNEGLAVISHDGKLGYINKSGEEVIAPFFDEAENFHNNYAVVGENGNYGIVNRSGKMIVPLSYSDIGDVNEGMAACFQDNICGYVNRSGKEVIAPVYNSCGDFNYGKSICEVKGLFGMIDEKGSEIMPFNFDAIIPIDSLLLKVQLNGKWGLFTRDGSRILNNEYDEIGDISENRIMVSKNNKVGYIDRHGVTVIPLIFDSYTGHLKKSEFSNGYAVVQSKNMRGIIDTTGERVVNFKYNDINTVTNNFVGVERNNRWGFIDISKDKLFINYKFEHVFNFVDGFAIVMNKDKWGVINTEGNNVVNFIYDEITYLGNRKFLAAVNDLYGVFDDSGKEIIPFEFDHHTLYDNKYIQIYNDTRNGWFNLEDNKFIFFTDK